MAATVPAPDQVDDLAVGVELALVGGVVAGPGRRRPAVALEVGEPLALDPAFTTGAVEDLQLLGVPGGRADHEGAERVRLGNRAQLRERPRAEAGVSYPGKPVVPVALAAHDLGQRRGRGRH